MRRSLQVRTPAGALASWLALLALSCDAPGAATRAVQDGGVAAAAASEAAAGQGTRAGDLRCTPPEWRAALPPELREASGLAPAAQRRQLWAHNDSERPARLYRIDAAGRVQQRVRVPVPIKDWEAIASARCPLGRCMYLADIGDNLHERPVVRVLRVREPASRDSVVRQIDVFPFRYPDGPADAEAIFVLPGERLFVITKGRNRAAALYRYPGRLRPDTVTLERLQSLGAGVAQFPDMVTGASATRSGRHVVVRTYAYLELYHVRNGSLVPDARIDLGSLAEPQGEAVALLDDGEVFLAGEHRNRTPGVLGSARCVLP